MRRYVTALILLLLAGGILTAQQIAGGPGVITYQGIITSSDGTPIIDGEYPITVTMYADEAGSVEIWQDTYTTNVRGGLFNIYLGSGTIPLPAPSQMDKARWIGTRISGGDEMRPLTRLSASPYAINVPDNAITTDKLADGAVTADKVDLDYISGVSINGKKIEINGKVLNIQAGKDIDISYDEATQSLVIGSPAQTGGAKDNKDGDRSLQGTQIDAWTLNGDGVNVNSGMVVNPTSSDWIGTNAVGSTPVDFNIRVFGTPIMSYQQKVIGSSPNIIGGVSNTVGGGAVGNVIAGGGGLGVGNTILGNLYNTISGGISHKIDNASTSYGTVGGGQNNEIGSVSVAATHGVIDGGQGNRVTGNYSAVGGGLSNVISSTHGAVAGGQSNTISAAHGAIAGGQSNSISAAHGAVGGGFTNRIFGSLGTIDGGGNNTIFHANSTYGSIGGGQGNEIGFSSFGISHGTIAGGRSNRVFGTYGTIGGGQSNFVGSYSTVAGGIGNSAGASFGAIAGGQGNVVDVDNGAIGGGTSNVITNNAYAGAIPGGDGLVAQSYGQAVVGVYNIPRGNLSPGDPFNDEPIFIVGNGDMYNTGIQSNAFEVSYSGHSRVFQNTNGATPVVLGATYVDNVVYAWGNVDPGGGRICDFGVLNVQQLGQGWYQIEMDLVDADGNPIQLNCGSVSATISSQQSPGSGWDGRCTFINASQIQGNIFDIYITDSGCGPIDEFFTFKVTGRP